VIRTRHLDATPLLRALLGVVVAIAVLVVAPNARAAGDDSVGFGVAPLRFDVDAKPGATLVQQIRITNTDTKATTFSFSKEDIEGDKDEPTATPILMGGKVESDISGYDWISAPDNVVVPAGDTKIVNVRVAVPTDAVGGHYAALVVTPTSRAADNLVLQSRMAVLFLMNAGGTPPPDIVITEVTQVGPNKTVTRYVNRGKTGVEPKPRITTGGRGHGSRRTTATGECTYALPGSAGECVVEETGKGDSSKPGSLVGGLPPKDKIELVTPEGSRATEDLPTEWASAWTSMLLPLVGVVLFVLYFLFLRRRRRDSERIEALDDYYTS
jgi:hypothetical protein